MKKHTLFALLATVFIDMLGVGILIPVIPQLLANPDSPTYLLSGIKASHGYILLGLLTAIFPLMQFFATPILGQMSDYYGRKKVLSFSIFGTALSYLLFAIGIVTRNLPLMFFSRALDGITGGNIAVAQAALSDISKPENRAKTFGMMGAAFGLGFILGPYIGGKLSDPHIFSFFTASTPFYFAAILSTLNGLSVLFLVPETLKVKAQKQAMTWLQSIKNIKRALSLKSLRVLLTVNFLFICGFSFFTTFFGVFLIHRFGFTQGRIGDFFAYVGIWIVFTQAVVTRLASKKFNSKQILNFSLIGVGIMMICYFLPRAPWQLFFVVPFFSIFQGLSMANVNSLISRSAGPEIQGEIMGISSSVQALAQTIPPILAGFIAIIFSPSTPIVVASIIIFIAGVFFVINKDKILLKQ